MNKLTIFFTVAVACAMGAPANPSLEAIRKLPALDHEEIHDELGQYSLRYVTAEGTIVVEKGRLIPNPNGEGMVMVVEGEVSYVGDDGQIYTTKYSAGVDGVKVEASHLPVAPLPPVVDVSALPVSVPAAVPLAPEVNVSAVPSVEVAAVPSVEVAAVPASPVVEVAAIPAGPLLPPLSVPVWSLPVESKVTVTAV